MSTIADWECSGCGLRAAQLSSGLGEDALNAVYYCEQCDRLRAYAVRNAAPTPAEPPHWVVRGHPRPCEYGHRLRGPIRLDLESPMQCPRCNQRELRAEFYAIGD